MQPFAALLDRLVLTPPRNTKLRLLRDYFRDTPDPDRGYALAALTGELDLPSVKPAMLRALVTARVDEILFWYSFDYVGDFAETLALIWSPRAAVTTVAPPEADPDLFSALPDGERALSLGEPQVSLGEKGERVPPFSEKPTPPHPDRSSLRSARSELFPP